MKIYKTTRKVEEIEFDEQHFFDYVKQHNPDDEDIQEMDASDEEDLYDSWCSLNLSDFFEDYCLTFSSKIEKNTMEQSENYHTCHEDAYEEMEWGIH